MPIAAIVASPATAEDAFAVLPQDLRAAIRVCAVQKIRHHPSNSGVGRSGRQGELKHGAPGLIGTYPQAAPVAVDDGATDREPHPNSAGLRGVEGFKNPLEISRINAWPGIAHRHEDARGVWLSANQHLS